MQKPEFDHWLFVAITTLKLSQFLVCFWCSLVTQEQLTPGIIIFIGQMYLELAGDHSQQCWGSSSPKIKEKKSEKKFQAKAENTT